MHAEGKISMCSALGHPWKNYYWLQVMPDAFANPPNFNWKIFHKIFMKIQWLNAVLSNILKAQNFVL